MLRATVWTMGLFGAGTAISRTFASGWTEPVVLLALGMAFLFVSRKNVETAPQAAPVRRSAAPDVVASFPQRAVAAKPAAAAVEQSA